MTLSLNRTLNVRLTQYITKDTFEKQNERNYYKPKKSKQTKYKLLLVKDRITNINSNIGFIKTQRKKVFDIGTLSLAIL